jgi:hypothetical protein
MAIVSGIGREHLAWRRGFMDGAEGSGKGWYRFLWRWKVNLFDVVGSINWHEIVAREIFMCLH